MLNTEKHPNEDKLKSSNKLYLRGAGGFYLFSFGCKICAGKVFHSWSVLAYKLRCEAGPHIDLLRVERKIKRKKKILQKRWKDKNGKVPKKFECPDGDRQGKLICKKNIKRQAPKSIYFV